MSGEAKTTTPDLTLRGAEASSSTATNCDCIKSPGAMTVYALILNFFVWVLSIASSQAIWFGMILFTFTPTKVTLLGVSSTTSEFFDITDAKSVGPLMTAGMAFLIIAFIVSIVQFITDVLAFFNIRHPRHTRKVDYLVAWVAMTFALIGTIIAGAGSSAGIAYMNKGGFSKIAFYGDGLGCGIVAILFGVANGVLRTYMARMPEDTNFKPPFHQWCSCCCAPAAEGAKATTLPAATAPPPAPSQQTA